MLVDDIYKYNNKKMNYYSETVYSWNIFYVLHDPVNYLRGLWFNKHTIITGEFFNYILDDLWNYDNDNHEIVSIANNEFYKHYSYDYIRITNKLYNEHPDKYIYTPYVDYNVNYNNLDLNLFNPGVDFSKVDNKAISSIKNNLQVFAIKLRNYFGDPNIKKYTIDDLSIEKTFYDLILYNLSLTNFTPIKLIHSKLQPSMTKTIDAVYNINYKYDIIWMYTPTNTYYFDTSEIEKYTDENLKIASDNIEITNNGYEMEIFERPKDPNNAFIYDYFCYKEFHKAIFLVSYLNNKYILIVYTYIQNVYDLLLNKNYKYLPQIIECDSNLVLMKKYGISTKDFIELNKNYFNDLHYVKFMYSLFFMFEELINANIYHYDIDWCNLLMKGDDITDYVLIDFSINQPCNEFMSIKYFYYVYRFKFSFIQLCKTIFYNKLIDQKLKYIFDNYGKNNKLKNGYDVLNYLNLYINKKILKNKNTKDK